MKPLLRALGLAVVVVSAAVPTAASASPAGPSVTAVAPTAGQSTYTPVAPVRLLDTRTQGGALGAGATVPLQVTGVAGVPLGARAVVLSVGALGATASTDVRVYPGPDLPGSSSVVVPRGGSASNLVVTAVGPGGGVVLRNAAGAVQLLVDVDGYYAEGPGSTYVPTSPDRLLDTRTTRTPLGAGDVRVLRVAGADLRVPAEATAVAVNVTAVGATLPTDVRVYPTGPGDPPLVSVANPGPGRPTAVAAVVAVGQDGSISLRNGRGTVGLIVDLQGWYLPSASSAPGSAFHPLAPRRLLDTRETGAGYPAPDGGPAVAAGAPRDLVVAGRLEVPAQATAVALTVTAVGATGPSDVRVYPSPADGASVPPTSTLNVVRGSLVANTVLVAVGRDGAVRLRNESGSVGLVVDLAGWYAPTGLGWDISWPQCTTAGATTSRLPDAGAFAVVGVTRGRPFTDNECLAAQWSWASTLPGEPSAYVVLAAPGSTDPRWALPGPRPCSGASSDAGCGYDFGYAAATAAAARVPATPSGGRPAVWLDVENGPGWQTGYAGAVAVNRAVLDGAAAGLRDAGLTRLGIYTDRASAGRDNDWVQIMGERRLPDLPLWVFRAATADPRPLCAPGESVTGGPVVLVQVQPAQSGAGYDVDDLC